MQTRKVKQLIRLLLSVFILTFVSITNASAATILINSAADLAALGPAGTKWASVQSGDTIQLGPAATLNAAPITAISIPANLSSITIAGNSSTDQYTQFNIVSLAATSLTIKDLDFTPDAMVSGIELASGSTLWLTGTNEIHMNGMPAVHIESGRALTINSTSTPVGMLVVDITNPGNAAAIGGADNENAGNITIKNGDISTVPTSGATQGAAIGGGSGGNGGTIRIENGTITIDKWGVGAGIGGGANAPGGSITLLSGTVDIKNTYGAAIGGGGGPDGSAGTISIGDATHAPIITAFTATGGSGIGSGEGGGPGTIKIYNGTIVATGSMSGPGIGASTGAGSIYIDKADIVAVGDNGSAAIGSGGNATSNGTITIDSGKITATSGIGGAGIGSGGNGLSQNIIINGGTIIASSAGQAAGIGNGAMNTSNNNITINGGHITATGGSDSAGIGGGPWSSGGTININNGTVIAYGGTNGAGIGGGTDESGGTITIKNGSINATGGNGAAGIGSGAFDVAGANDIFFLGGNITATGGGGAGNGGAGIGGGMAGPGGNVTIQAGHINATGGTNAAGIGGGTNGNGATMVMHGGTVIAASGSPATTNAIGAGNGGTAGNTVTIDGGSLRADMQVGAAIAQPLVQTPGLQPATLVVVTVMANGQPVPNAKLNVTGPPQYLDTYTDSTGRAWVYLQDGLSHIVNAEKSGYNAGKATTVVLAATAESLTIELLPIPVPPIPVPPIPVPPTPPSTSKPGGNGNVIGNQNHVGSDPEPTINLSSRDEQALIPLLSTWVYPYQTPQAIVSERVDEGVLETILTK